MKNKWNKRLHTPLHTPSLYLTTVTGMRNAIRIAMPLVVQRYTGWGMQWGMQPLVPLVLEMIF